MFYFFIINSPDNLITMNRKLVQKIEIKLLSILFKLKYPTSGVAFEKNKMHNICLLNPPT